MMEKVKWTYDKKIELKKLYDKYGNSPSKIAKELGVSVPSVTYAILRFHKPDSMMYKRRIKAK